MIIIIIIIIIIVIIIINIIIIIIIINQVKLQYSNHTVVQSLVNKLMLSSKHNRLS